MSAPVKRRILFFGDSITAGEGDDETLGWPGRLIAMENRRLAPEGLRLQGYPLGIGGDRFDHLADRWQAEAHSRLAARPGAIVLMIGVNDALRAAATTGRVPHDLDRIIARADRLGAALAGLCPALWLAPAPVHPDLLRGDGATGVAVNDGVRLLTGVFRDVAARSRIPFLCLPLAEDRVYLDALGANDGLRPTGAGHQRIADLLSASAAWTSIFARM
jgi:acyl-CoA thioesterase I